MVHWNKTSSTQEQRLKPSPAQVVHLKVFNRSGVPIFPVFIWHFSRSLSLSLSRCRHSPRWRSLKMERQTLPKNWGMEHVIIRFWWSTSARHWLAGWLALEMIKWPDCFNQVRRTQLLLPVVKSGDISGQYYKASTSVNYDSRAIIICNLLVITTLEL